MLLRHVLGMLLHHAFAGACSGALHATARTVGLRGIRAACLRAAARSVSGGLCDCEGAREREHGGQCDCP